MTSNRRVFVQCRFTRGGFGHERVFWIPTPDGQGEYRGLAYIAYCYRSNRKPLSPDEPPPGESINGLIIGRWISESDDGIVTIQVPDGELCEVSSSIIQEGKDVPVGS